MGLREMLQPTREDAVQLVGHLLNTRPLPEAVREIDKHADLLPQFAKVRDKAAKGDRAASLMEFMLAVDQRRRP